MVALLRFFLASRLTIVSLDDNYGHQLYIVTCSSYVKLQYVACKLCDIILSVQNPIYKIIYRVMTDMQQICDNSVDLP